MTLIRAVRTAVFYLLFLGQTAVLAIFIGTVAIATRRRTALNWAIARYWGRSNLWLLRWVVGIRSEVLDAGLIPPGPAIIAAKHQSDWDIFTILPLAGRPAFIAERELMDIPFFGAAARSFDTISIDRKAGGVAVPQMLAEAREALGRGCRIIIFPEGTRRAPGAPPVYRQGIVRLYESLGVPVIPVALNSGLFWGRNSLLMRPGLAQARVLQPIPPGLPAEEFRVRLERVIETETARLMGGEAGIEATDKSGGHTTD